MYQVVTASRFHSALPSSSCIHVRAGGVTKTRTSVNEVSFPYGKLLEIKFCLLNYIFFLFQLQFCRAGGEESVLFFD